MRQALTSAMDAITIGDSHFSNDVFATFGSFSSKSPAGHHQPSPRTAPLAEAKLLRPPLTVVGDNFATFRPFFGQLAPGHRQSPPPAPSPCHPLSMATGGSPHHSAISTFRPWALAVLFGTAIGTFRYSCLPPSTCLPKFHLPANHHRICLSTYLNLCLRPPDETHVAT